MVSDSSVLADLPTLSRLFSSRLDQSVTVTEIRRSKMGNGQETWFVETTLRPFVLRRSATGGPLVWTSRAAEFEALSSLQEVGLPVPRVLWQEPDGGSLQRAYFVMEHLPGKPPARQFDDDMAFKLGQMLAQLHQNTRTCNQVEAQTYLPTKLTETREKYADTLFANEPLALALFGWLESHVPQHAFHVVRLWGDPGPHNMLVSNGHVSGLLDWEMTSLGHPGEDLGSARWSVLGFASPQSIDRGYASVAAAATVQDGDWFEVLAHLIRAGQALDGTAAFLRSETDEVTLPAMGLGLVTANLLRAATVAWQQPELMTVKTPPAPVPTDNSRDQIVMSRLTEVSARLAMANDNRSATRQRIAEVVKLAYQNGAHRHCLPSEHSADLHNVGQMARAQEVSGHSLDLRRMLVDDVRHRRSRMTELLSYFGATTSTSVAK